MKKIEKIEMITTREFNDLEENKFRKRGEKFYCSTKKRSERLIERGLAKIVNEEVEEVVNEIVEESKED